MYRCRPNLKVEMAGGGRRRVKFGCRSVVVAGKPTSSQISPATNTLPDGCCHSVAEDTCMTRHMLFAHAILAVVLIAPRCLAAQYSVRRVDTVTVGAPSAAGHVNIPMLESSVTTLRGDTITWTRRSRATAGSPARTDTTVALFTADTVYLLHGTRRALAPRLSRAGYDSSVRGIVWNNGSRRA